MYGDSPRPQVIDAQYATNHISPQVVEYQDLPYGFAVGVEEGS